MTRTVCSDYTITYIRGVGNAYKFVPEFQSAIIRNYHIFLHFLQPIHNVSCDKDTFVPQTSHNNMNAWRIVSYTQLSGNYVSCKIF